ncbi:MAG: hypothetical protein COU11_02715 [Candidatus Harrisonbacteria bacterium CG10_big_fil_rev_8_21_14_0_10_49_15]|uniref:Peptidase M16 n=1 Tax=Candidatus Harrisonbacteria bacterium CG10_big_fil_rev_8_21_14_0_10_49_15 TaxID=1974587 RepID=A0A2H0UMX3_9BACT|nr:MAG: hypothetical protein COU11_02715 [Candidatus Harrisonbacteria bacterium CG10_big_fil_rev_8_21_14_0_10_49_15]
MKQSYKKTTLENGLRIITVPQPGNLATTVLVLVETGSKYETKNISGVAHFLEHMCFKGTVKRPSARVISSELDGLGASYNAFTSQEYTGYYAKVENHKNGKALELIADLYLNPIFDEKEIETEKGVVIEELNMYEDMPQRKIYDYFMHLLYGDQPAGWDIGGDREILKKMKREDFLKFRGEHYLPEHTTLIIAGGFDEEALLNSATELFKSMPSGGKGQKLAVTESQSEPALMLKHKESDQTHLRIGFRAFSMFDKRRYAAEVLADLLGGGMSSRLFHKVREDLGAAYYVGAEADLYTDHGYVAAYAGVEHSKLKTVISAMLTEFKRLQTELVPDEELVRTKSHLSGNLLLGLETSSSLAVFYGTQEVLKREVTSPEELLIGINAVTAEEIQAVAKELFKSESLNMVLIGPQKEEGEFKELLRSF